ncbi:MAG TPA: hypothetical protein VFV78_02880 [Vicinamibacterales bacterium]|nr:hypothetical protein [Vicinamibacterales bacterium]
MTRGTRYFLAGSAFVAILGLGTGLVAYYNGGLPGVSRGSEADLAFLPAGAAAVGFADVRAIMNSEFRQKLRQVLPTGEELNHFKTELGVDIEHDIDTVAAAYLGGPTPFSGAVVIVRGRFNDVNIETIATQHGAVAEQYKNVRVLTFTHPVAAASVADTPLQPGEQIVDADVKAHPVPAVAFLQPGVLALGESDAVKKAIDAGESGEDLRKNTELKSLIDEVRGTGNAWFVGRTDMLAQHSGMPQEVVDHLPAVSLFAASVHVNGGLSGALRAEARDSKSAEQLRDVIRGALAAGKLVSGDNPKMDAMLSSLQITGSGNSVGLTFAVPPELLDLLNGLAAAHHLNDAPVKK